MYFCHCKQINPSISVKKSSAIISQASPKKQIIVIKSLFLQFDFFASFNASLKDRIVKHKNKPLNISKITPIIWFIQILRVHFLRIAELRKTKIPHFFLNRLS